MAKEEKVDSEKNKKEERKIENFFFFFFFFANVWSCLFSFVCFIFLTFFWKQGLSKPELIMEKVAVADVAFPTWTLGIT